MSRIDRLAVSEVTKDKIRKEADIIFETMVKVKNVVEKRKTYDDALHEVKEVVFATSLDANEREKVVKAISRFAIVCMYQGYYVHESGVIENGLFKRLKNLLKVR